MTSSPQPTAFLFTDIKDGTVMWDQSPDVMRASVQRHFDLGRVAVARHGGRIVKEMGDGLMAAFDSARAAIQAALQFQLHLLAEPWPAATPILVRMGLDFGPAQVEPDGDFKGEIVNQAARVSGAAHGGQILLGESIVHAATKPVAPKTRVVSLGRHRFKGISRNVEVFQLVHPELPRHFRPIESLLPDPDNLPFVDAAFFGQEETLRAIEAAFLEARVVSLVGPSGIGKTRLAMEFVARRRAASKAPAYFQIVDSGFTRDGAVERFRIHSRLVREPDLGKLLSRMSLLVLDNCESALEQVALLVAEASPHVPVITTTTRPIDIRAERIVRVKPMPTPQADVGDAALSHNPSAQLFRWAFERRGGDAHGIAREALLALLAWAGGIPLAIELLAAAAADRGVAETLEFVRQSDGLVASPYRDAPSRHHTLEAAFDWIVGQLGERERAALAALAESPDGATIGQLTSIAAMSSRSEARKAVARLDQMGLAAPTSTSPRWSMIEGLRRLALDRLSGPAVRRRHAVVFARDATRAGAKLRGPSSTRANRFFYENRRNLVKALQEAPSPMAVLAYCRWLVDEGSVEEANRWLDVSLASAATQAEAAALKANVARLRMRPQEAHEWCGRALELGANEKLERYVGAVRILTLIDERQFAGAMHEGKRLLEDPSQVAADATLASAMTNVGLAYRKAKDLHNARLLFSRAAEAHAKRRDLLGRARALTNLAITLLDEGDGKAALPHVEESLALFRHCRNAAGIAHCIHALGDAFYYQGKRAQALRRYRNAARRFSQLGHPWMSLAAELSTANVLYCEGKYAEAAALLETVFADAIAQGIPEHAAHALDTLTGVWSHRDRPDIVLTLANMARSLRNGADIDPHCPVDVKKLVRESRAREGVLPPNEPPPRNLLEARLWISKLG